MVFDGVIQKTKCGRFLRHSAVLRLIRVHDALFTAIMFTAGCHSIADDRNRTSDPSQQVRHCQWTFGHIDR